MAIEFKTVVNGNIKSSLLSENLQLTSAYNFMQETVKNLNGTNIKDILPGVKSEPYQSEISGNSMVYTTATDSAHFGFNLKHDYEKSQTILSLVQRDPFLHESRGGYGEILESKGSWKEIGNDMKELIKQPNLLNVDPLSKVEFRNVVLTAAVLANFKDSLNTAQDHLLDYGNKGEVTSLKLAANSLTQALSAFGHVTDKEPKEIHFKDGEFKFPITQNATMFYGQPKESKEIGRLPQDGLFIKLDNEAGHNLHGLKTFIKDLAKTKGVLNDHLDANKNVLANAEKSTVAERV